VALVKKCGERKDGTWQERQRELPANRDEVIPGTKMPSAGAEMNPADLQSKLLFSVSLDIQIDRTCRHDRGNSMLVDHLRDGVTQQYHVLIKRFDMSLQFDAVDQIDRDGDMLFSQGVQEGVL
jgi:hypothetical protein